jgi:Fe-S-cluster containining protein
MLAESDLLEASSLATQASIEHFEESLIESAKKHLFGISCHTCTAKKACCYLKVEAYLHEAVVIVARLLRENRDTPELRQQLKEAAHYMETTPKMRQARPCVFLGADDRCTIYEDRPSTCGVHFVSSPPEHCADDTIPVSVLVDERWSLIPQQLEAQFVAQAGLRRLDLHYSAVLPRMVLICLEAWNRRDYVQFLADRCLPAAHRLAQIQKKRKHGV